MLRGKEPSRSQPRASGSRECDIPQETNLRSAFTLPTLTKPIRPQYSALRFMFPWGSITRLSGEIRSSLSFSNPIGFRRGLTAAASRLRASRDISNCCQPRYKGTNVTHKNQRALVALHNLEGNSPAIIAWKRDLFLLGISMCASPLQCQKLVADDSCCQSPLSQLGPNS